MASDLARIEALLPHRAPFLFVDRVVEEGPGILTAEWHVPADLFAFAGHFPGNPVLPGVLLSEHCFQTGALLIYSDAADRAAPGVPVLVKIEHARFRRIVRPNTLLRTTVKLESKLAQARLCSAKVETADGALVARLTFTLAIAAEDRA